MTPIESILVRDSALHDFVGKSLAALDPADKRLIDIGMRSSFADSLDLDTALERAHAEANRWDYLLGHRNRRSVFGLEAHRATTAEVSVVIAKRRAAIDQLRGHLRPGKRVAAWFWVASGKVNFLPHERSIRQLADAGIKFVGRKLREVHLLET